MSIFPDEAFVLAAGKGTRLRPLTDDKPKPMVNLWGQPIVAHVLDGLKAEDIKAVTLNTNYAAPVIHDYLETRTDMNLTISHEQQLLDTGGGIKNALNTFQNDSFFCVSGDSVWSDGPSGKTLQRLAAAWDPDKMDLLMLMQPLERMTLTQGSGDYDINANGQGIRQKDKSGGYMWTSVRICHKRLFNNTPDTPFSFLHCMDAAEAAGRLYALVHDGAWYHISTPEDLALINSHQPDRLYA